MNPHAPGSVLLHADDATFVRAPEALAYRRLTHLAAWPAWWRGCDVAPADGIAGAERWLITWRVAPARRLRVLARPHGWRHDLGFELELTGDLTGRSEVWLEPTHGGTVVHQLLAATTALSSPRRVLADHRRAVRRGMWGLKDVLQMEARSTAGLRP